MYTGNLLDGYLERPFLRRILLNPRALHLYSSRAVNNLFTNPLRNAWGRTKIRPLRFWMRRRETGSKGVSCSISVRGEPSRAALRRNWKVQVVEMMFVTKR